MTVVAAHRRDDDLLADLPDTAGAGPDPVGPEPSTRFRELAVHVVERSVADPHMDYDKLEEVLFTADALAVGELGAPLTGSEYVKHASGPEALQPRLEELTDAVALVPRSDGAPVLVALRPADTTSFSAEELGVVERVVTELAPFRACDAAAYAHGWMTGYALAHAGERLPRDVAALG